MFKQESNSESQVSNLKFKTQNSELDTHHSKFKIQNSKLQ